MRFIKENQLNGGHFHAWCLFEPVSLRHFLYLLVSVVVCRVRGFKSVTTHLPLELQHNEYPDRKTALKLIGFGRHISSFLKVNLYWENAPLLNYGKWDLKHGQADWDLVPRDVFICLDTGHQMLGSTSAEDARRVILKTLDDRKDQIKHLHIHENDFRSDLHKDPGEVITPEFLEKITAGRTYIFEK